ncbi:887_t:CDS:2, partial [Diversispora eburnea]
SRKQNIFDEQPSQEQDNKGENVNKGKETKTSLQEQAKTREEDEIARHTVRAKLYCM